ncbi:MAG TPA: CopG family antitoxin [Candidatus Saccharimonadales bacterium]|nr:CopG family antitoxin [Candidatus Saccharimonadales bacterium]
MKKKLIVPKFKNEDEEYKFWSNLDLSEYFEPADFKRFVYADLVNKSKPKTKKITIRLPEQWIEQTKSVAAQMDIPYQSLMKQFISKGLHTINK